MNTGFNGGRRATAVVLASLWLVWSGAALPGAQQLSPSNDLTDLSTENPAQTVWLEYRELPYGVINWGLSIKLQNQAFLKEPNVGQRKVFRGSLQFGNDGEQSMPFLWDHAKGKLYLDLNRNRDLTDDPAGVFSAPLRQYSSSYQTFTNVVLTFPAPADTHRVLANLSLYDFNNQPGGSVECRSFWEAKLSLRGRDWQLGFIENLSGKLDSPDGGHLLLRPWDSRAQPFNLQDGSLDGFGFCRNLFFDGQAYRLECVYARQEGSPSRYKITVEERPAELGELKLPGKFIKRLILIGNGNKPGAKRYTVVLDRPAALVKIPVGAYGQCQIALEAGGIEAYRDFNRYGSALQSSEVIINSTNAASLAVGGPLTNSVLLNRQGASLSLNYQLVGADGARYQLTRQDRSRPPRFAIYQAGKEIASGKFEFG